MATASEALQFTSALPGPLTLKGGRYLIGCTATFGGGSVAFQSLLPDLLTYATVPDVAGSAVSFTAAGWRVVDLAPGQYKLVIVTSTVVIVRATSIPG